LSVLHSNSKRTALIVGCRGQDGCHLSSLLDQKDYCVVGVGRNDVDVTDAVSVRELMASCWPDEIYLLAAYHHSSESSFESDGDLFQKSMAVHTTATVHFLETISVHTPKSRLFFASSSHIFPDGGLNLLDESTPPAPGSIYAITKYGGMLACRYYRERRNVFASCGILFNHESSLRAPHFLSRKIVTSAVRIAGGMDRVLELGNLDAVVDWGYAPDYVEAMWRMLQTKVPGDYVIATGIPHTVREFVEIAFRCVGLDYRPYVSVRPDLLTKSVETRLGNSGYLRQYTGWSPSIDFEEMIERMVRHELVTQSVFRGDPPQ
jgi:GDPmannose 4,6-dehydratase